MRTVALTFLVAVAVLAGTAAWADGSITLWYRGSFDGQVVVKDGYVPGYYYHPSPTKYPTFAQYYDHPVVCDKCGHYRKLGETCPWCGAEPSQQELKDARGETVYSPHPLPGQYWYKPQPHFTFRSPIRVDWPYIKYDQPRP